MNSLVKADGICNLFFFMNLYWNYLSYQLLAHLIGDFSLDEVRGEISQYEEDLQHFLAKRPAKMFCQVQTIRKKEPPEGFAEMVAEFMLPADPTLLKVEDFRKQFICHFGLHDCAIYAAQLYLTRVINCHLAHPRFHCGAAEEGNRWFSSQSVQCPVCR